MKGKLRFFYEIFLVHLTTSAVGYHAQSYGVHSKLETVLEEADITVLNYRNFSISLHLIRLPTNICFYSRLKEAVIKAL